MDTTTLIVSLILAGGVLALVLYPLWRQTRSQTTFRVDRHPGQTLEEYQARYQAALAAIKDLMFDHEMGKVSTEDYEALLPRAKLEAAEIRRQIDQFSQYPPATIDQALDTTIESLVAQLRQGQLNGNEALLGEVEAEIESLKHGQFDPQTGHLTCPNCGKTFEVGDAFCSRCGHSLAEDTCPQCGQTFQPGDAFCAKCGTALENNITTRKQESLNIQAVDNQ
jgi:predicted nucleic acid-binding Zn ribbon protein